MIGFSLGAAVTLIEASCHQNIDSVISVSSPSDLGSIHYNFWKEETEEDIRHDLKIGKEVEGVSPGSLALQKLPPGDVVGKIAPLPVLFLHGGKDALVKLTYSQLLFRKARQPKVLKIMENGGHAEKMFDVFPDQFMKICLNRFKETL